MENPIQPDVRKNNPLCLTAGILAIGSLVISLIGLLINFFLPGTVLILCGVGLLMNLVALILGIIGLVQLKKNPGQKGKGLAITGIVFSAIAVVLICLTPILLTTILALLGPYISNVFSEINTGLTP